MLKYECGKGYVPGANHSNEVVSTVQRTQAVSKPVATSKRRGRPVGSGNKRIVLV